MDESTEPTSNTVIEPIENTNRGRSEIDAAIDVESVNNRVGQIADTRYFQELLIRQADLKSSDPQTRRQAGLHLRLAKILDQLDGLAKLRNSSKKQDQELAQRQEQVLGETRRLLELELKVIDPKLTDGEKMLARQELEMYTKKEADTIHTSYTGRLIELKPYLRSEDRNRRTLAGRELELTRRLTRNNALSPDELVELLRIRAITETWSANEKAA